jgi:hypothetical protein
MPRDGNAIYQMINKGGPTGRLYFLFAVGLRRINAKRGIRAYVE